MKISKQKGKSLPAIGRSITGGGDSPSVVEVAASLPARLLGAMEELKSSENLNEEERGERDLFL